MADSGKVRVHVDRSPMWDGAIWLGGWLFTIGYLHLPFWRALLGLLIWPYYLGASLAVR